MQRLFIADANYKKGLSAADRFLSDKAERYFKAAVSFAPHNSEYTARLAELYAYRARFGNNRYFYQNRSMDLYRKAILLNPYNGNLRIEAGIADARYGRKKAALAEFKKAILLDPHNSFYKGLLAEYEAKAVISGI